jgi:VanZ family protein
MRRLSLLYIAGGFMVLVAVLNAVAVSLSLYWSYWWFDIVMHTLSGFAGGLFVLWLFHPFRAYQSLWLTLGSLLVVGVVWEIFEWVFDLIQPLNYRQDIVYDLLNDLLGALLAYVYVYATYVIARSLKSF